MNIFENIHKYFFFKCVCVFVLAYHCIINAKLFQNYTTTIFRNVKTSRTYQQPHTIEHILHYLNATIKKILHPTIKHHLYPKKVSEANF